MKNAKSAIYGFVKSPLEKKFSNENPVNSVKPLTILGEGNTERSLYELNLKERLTTRFIETVGPKRARSAGHPKG